MQPGVEDHGQRARIPGAAGQPERLVGQRAPPRSGRGVAEQLAGQPGEDPGLGGVVAGSFGGQFQEPDQVLVDVEEGRGGRGAQGQVDDWVLVLGEFPGERQGRSRQAARGYPQGLRRLGVGYLECLGEVGLAEAG